MNKTINEIRTEIAKRIDKAICVTDEALEAEKQSLAYDIAHNSSAEDIDYCRRSVAFFELRRRAQIQLVAALEPLAGTSLSKAFYVHNYANTALDEINEESTLDDINTMNETTLTARVEARVKEMLLKAANA